MAVDAGQAEVEDDGVGVAAGGQVQALLAGGGEVDLVAPGLQVGGQRADDGRLVVDHQDPGHVSRLRRAASGPPVARGLADADGRRRSGRRPACPRGGARRPWRRRSPGRWPGRGRRPSRGPSVRWKGSKTCSRSSARRCPGPGRRPGGRPRRATVPASTRTGRAGGRPLQRVVDQVGHHPLEQGPVGDDRREVFGHVHDHFVGPGPEAGQRGQRPPPSTVTGTRLGADGAGLEAAHVEQVADQAVEAVGLLLDGAQELRLLLGRPGDLPLAEAADRGLDRRPAACAGRGTPPAGARRGGRWPRPGRGPPGLAPAGAGPRPRWPAGRPGR